MLTEKDIKIKDTGGDYWVFADIDVPVKLFGKLRFEGDEESSINISVPKGTDMMTWLPQINKYLAWVADGCASVLTKKYVEENQWSLDEYFEGKLPEDWYETLEVLGATIAVEEDGCIGIRVTFGDNIFEDHLLCVEFSGKEIIEMYYDG